MDNAASGARASVNAKAFFPLASPPLWYIPLLLERSLADEARRVCFLL